MGGWKEGITDEVCENLVSDGIKMAVVAEVERFQRRIEVVSKKGGSIEAGDIFCFGELKEGSAKDVLELSGGGCRFLNKGTSGQQEQVKLSAGFSRDRAHRNNDLPSQ